MEITQLLAARKYDPDTIPKEQHIAFKIQGKCIGTIGNYCCINGLPKVGKSTFISALIASAVLPAGMDHFGMKLYFEKNRNKIAFFDTESSLYDFYRVIERIKLFSGTNEYLHPNIDAFNTREDNPKKIREMIYQYLKETPDCSILIVDGLLDLCLNYNDEIESRLLVNYFKRITKEFNILMIGVLHLSKSNSESIGHLGSNTDRWAQSSMIVEKNKETKQIVLKPKFLRSTDDFDPIALMNFDGHWSQVPYEHYVDPKRTLKK